MLNAREAAKGIVDVELLSAQFAEDNSVVPAGFRPTRNLERSVLDRAQFKKPIRLPLLRDILQRLYDESDADYLIYTNVDIGLYPDFYLKVKTFIDEGRDAFIINRRRLPAIYTSTTDLDTIYKDPGKDHPGFDCFVLKRHLFPRLKLEGICIGVPFVEIAFSQNLFALANNFKLYDKEQLTFHIGMEIFRRRVPREYFWYNRKQFHEIEQLLFPEMHLSKFPYYEKPAFQRFFTWLAHPCIPTRLVLKLWWRG